MSKLKVEQPIIGDSSLESGSRRENLDIVFERRKFIWRQVTRYGRLSFDDIEGEFKGTSTVAIQGDLEFWTKLGFHFVSQPTVADKRRREVVDKSANQFASKQTRTLTNSAEKQLVGHAAMGLLAGFQNWQEKTLRNNDVADMVELSDGEELCVPKDFEDCYTVEEIKAELYRRANGDKCEPGLRTKIAWLVNRLDQFYREHTRLVSVDAGTTCEVLASHISRLRTPSPSTKLTHLTVCTNSRGVFQILGVPEVNAKVIIIGGEQRGRTDAIAGRLAELFLENASILRFGIAFVGATMIDFDHNQCCSESQVISRLKAQIFSKSALRVLCADNYKLSTRPMWAAFPFVALTPEQIDLVLTNLPIPPTAEQLKKSEAKEKYRETASQFIEAVRHIESLGIPVFCAVPRSMWFPDSSGAGGKTVRRPVSAEEAVALLDRWEKIFI